VQFMEPLAPALKTPVGRYACIGFHSIYSDAYRKVCGSGIVNDVAEYVTQRIFITGG